MKTKAERQLDRDVSAVLSGLRNAKTTNDGDQVVAGYPKKVLVAAGRQRDVAVTSQDTVAVIRRKLVRATVGARLESHAIRHGSWRRR